MAAFQEEGTVKPASRFDPEADCKILRKAMKGLGTDEKAIIDVLAYRSNAQRQQLRTLFKTMYGKDLIDELKSELGGKFEDVVLGLMAVPADYDAYEIRRAIQGVGTDEDCLIEILCSRSNAQINALTDSYKTKYKSKLENDIKSDTSGHFKRLLVSMTTAGRMENQSPDPAKAAQDANDLYQAGAARLGTDESRFNQILASQSFAQLRLVFEEYHKKTGKSIEQAIKSEMSGDLEKGMLTVVKVVKNRPAYFAEKLYKSMKGLGTDDKALIRVMVTRCEVDMIQIKREFQLMYGKSLESFIADDCSGDYKRILLALVRPR